MIDLTQQINVAFALDDRKSHKKHAESRDAMLALISAHPEVFDDPTQDHLRLIRGAAERCGNVGPFAKAVELFRKLAPMSQKAGDYYRLSEVLTHGGEDLGEAVAALRMAMQLDPAFDTPGNRETVSLAL